MSNCLNFEYLEVRVVEARTTSKKREHVGEIAEFQMIVSQ
jgi:hypothetical protein